jgi:hypothetical protein
MYIHSVPFLHVNYTLKPKLQAEEQKDNEEKSLLSLSEDEG